MRIAPVAAGLLIAVVLAFTLAPGCNEHATGPDPPDYLPQDSPENVIANLELAYNARDLDAYARLFAEDFVFQFDPQDLTDRGLPPGMVFRFEDDSLSTRHMFRNEIADRDLHVSRIRLELTFNASVPVNEPGHEGERRILVSNTSLRVDTQSDFTMVVAGDRAEFFFRRGRTPGASESTVWYIVRWRDLPERIGI
jgi:hypothetical protein